MKESEFFRQPSYERNKERNKVKKEKE